jgi:hypothetical protein
MQHCKIMGFFTFPFLGQNVTLLVKMWFQVLERRFTCEKKIHIKVRRLDGHNVRFFNQKA